MTMQNQSTGLRRAGLFSLLVLTGTAVLADQESKVIRLSEPVEVTDEYEIFGAALPDGEAPLPLATVLENGETHVDRQVVVTTRVSQVCQMKGCFFIAQDGAYTARVSFKDYSFFVPTDISGRTVTLSGQLTHRDVSAEQAAHYNADMKGEGVTAGRQYEIVATSVRVPRS